MTGIVDFLLARIAEDEMPTWELVSYSCEPGCCAPAGYVGHKCLICGDTTYGGTVEFITEICQDHDEKIHRRSRMLAECAAKRKIIEDHGYVHEVINWADGSSGDAWCRTCGSVDDSPVEWPCRTLRALAAVYADHADYQQEWAL